MTLAEFKNAHIFPTENPRLGATYMEFNLLYNEYESIYRLDAISVRVDGRLGQLQQATSLTFKVPGTGDYVTIRLNDIDFPIEVISTGDYFIYALAPKESEISLRPIISTPSPDISTGVEVYTTSLLISPYSQEQSYTTSDYNAVYNSNVTDRSSNYIMKSEREGSEIHPTNLGSILSGKAAPAPVQDSYYTDTGWSNARYLGSKLTNLTNNGVDPILPGTFFKGTIFDISTPDDYIKSIDPTLLIYEEYLSSGKSSLPQFRVEDLALAPHTVNPGISGTALELKTPLGVTPTILPKDIPLYVGDLLILSGSSGLSSEVLQIVPPTGTQIYFPYEYYQRVPDYEYLRVRIARGYADTEPQTITLTYPNPPYVYRIDPITVYTVKGTLVQAATKGKILIKETGEILYTSATGRVIGGSSVVAL